MTRSAMILLQLVVVLLPALVASAYVSSTALMMTHMSNIAYESQSAIDNWSCSDCKRYAVQNHKSFFSSAANIQGFTAYLVNQNAIILSFRGSADIKNWIANLDTVSVTYPGCAGCRVHQGFNFAYEGAGNLVRSAVQNLQALHRGVPVIITGHSLGGAMAVLATLDLKHLGIAIKEVYTFGQPRVGDANFAAYLQKSTPEFYHVINYADIVPHLPPGAFGFQHGGHEVWYNPRGMQSHTICTS